MKQGYQHATKICDLWKRTRTSCYNRQWEVFQRKKKLCTFLSYASQFIFWIEVKCEHNIRGDNDENRKRERMKERMIFEYVFYGVTRYIFVVLPTVFFWEVLCWYLQRIYKGSLYYNMIFLFNISCEMFGMVVTWNKWLFFRKKAKSIKIFLSQHKFLQEN